MCKPKEQFQVKHIPSSSGLQTERAVSSQIFCTIPETSIETRGTQENTSTQAVTNELSASEKKKRERWSES